jgi:hypothetical protein
MRSVLASLYLQKRESKQEKSRQTTKDLPTHTLVKGTRRKNSRDHTLPPPHLGQTIRLIQVP